MASHTTWRDCQRCGKLRNASRQTCVDCKARYSLCCVDCGACFRTCHRLPSKPQSSISASNNLPTKTEVEMPSKTQQELQAVNPTSNTLPTKTESESAIKSESKQQEPRSSDSAFGNVKPEVQSFQTQTITMAGTDQSQQVSLKGGDHPIMACSSTNSQLSVSNDSAKSSSSGLLCGATEPNIAEQIISPVFQTLFEALQQSHHRREEELKKHHQEIESFFLGLFSHLSGVLTKGSTAIAETSIAPLIVAPPKLDPLNIAIVFAPGFPKSIPHSLISGAFDSFFYSQTTYPFKITQFQSYEEALSSLPTAILYVCFTTGTRYSYDLPLTFKNDLRTQKVFLLSVFTGSMSKSSATWSPDLADFVYDTFIDEEKGPFFETMDANERLRINENTYVLKRLYGNIFTKSI